MVMNKKGITPIISVILLLMMSVAVAGIAWFWMQSMTQRVMSQTEQGTTQQLTTMQGSLLVQASTCNTSAATDATIVVYNPGTTTTASSLVVGGSVNSASGTLTGGAASAVTVTTLSGSVVGTNTAILNTAVGSVTFSMTCVA